MNRSSAKRLEGIGEYYFSQKLREIDEMNRKGDPVINLGIGSPDLPPHPEVIKVVAEEIVKTSTHAYQSYKGIAPLREAMAKWYNRWYDVQLDAASEILPLIGSKEGIMHISMAFLNEGDEVLIPDPGYPTYKSATSLAGGKSIPYPLKEEYNWQPDFEILESLVTDKTRMMWVNYPHMPTGQLPVAGTFEKLVGFARKHHILLCHDNPYSFILNSKPESILKVQGAKEVAIELNSLSKSHNMAGWRIGMLCGAQDKIDEVLRFKSNMDSGMFLPLQLAAIKALQLGDEWHTTLNNTYQERREVIYRMLDILHCSYESNQAGLFIWARIPDKYANGFLLSDEVLQKASVFVTPGGIFGNGGNEYIRVSLCNSVDTMERAIERIAKHFSTI